MSLLFLFGWVKKKFVDFFFLLKVASVDSIHGICEKINFFFVHPNTVASG